MPKSANFLMVNARYEFRFQDTTQQAIPADTLHIRQNQQTEVRHESPDSAAYFFLELPTEAIRKQAEALTRHQETPPPAPVVPVKPAFDFHPAWNFNTNIFLENGITRAVARGGFFKTAEAAYPEVRTTKPAMIQPHERVTRNLDWFVGLFLLLSLLFVWIRIFYGKYFSLLASALTSFQLSAKLYREKNVLVHRVSLVLDFIYLLVLTMFLFELILRYGWFNAGANRLDLFLILFNILILYTLVRLGLWRFTGVLFLKRNLFSEYIHNNFVVNKGTGILLFPVVITAHYFPIPLIPFMLLIGVIILASGFIWKVIRAFQIIRRKDIVLFYLILYLCTLEILPFLLGYKLVMTLI